MYIPIMKNRQEEMRVLNKMNPYFNDSIIPLIEIFKDEHEDRFKKDPITGDILYELKPNNKIRTKIKLPPEDKDIITLQFIQEKINNKYAFIDFFRFTIDEYDRKKLDYNNIKLSLQLSRDFSSYRSRLLDLGNYNNLIPVISIKSGLEISEFDLDNLISELRNSNSSICLRVTVDCFDEYNDFIEDNLTENDFIMLDLRSKSHDSKQLELEEFQDLNTGAVKVLLNSPRPVDKRNKDFDNLVFTKIINNDVATAYLDYELNGFGDFGGLKDDLPQSSGSNGTGSALGLIFSKERNAFFSVVNTDTSMGVRGYKYVAENILNHKHILDIDNDCPAIERINHMKGTFGSWKDWNNINLTRYIHQQATK
ncbi:hypothetical protein KFZ56_16360 [Virgibacillus sp. NKC19-3]|uniref:beta family protein n=1 Tax=Virgibacillus saliphilus TaxID=2831674 RepID=UPI001C9B1E09|nr:beta family protein [Virgibacillus sp. NKC19-3]MBY7144595.1 hypothetical protein [Virgibacillus sp. NKC19-3]